MLIISWMRGVVGPNEVLCASTLTVLTIILPLILASMDCASSKSIRVSEDAPGEAARGHC